MMHENGTPVKSVSLFVDCFGPPDAWLLQSLLDACDASGITVSSATPSAVHLREFGLDPKDSADAALVLGGDGSILRGMDHFMETGVPVLGINTGHLGFLAVVEKDGMTGAVDRLGRGDFVVESLPLMLGELPSGRRLRAVNDFSLNRQMMGGILHFDVLVDGAQVARVTGDGLVVSTPLGSTAYGLSCGGPILDPGLPAMLVVPICPHSLSLRPLVVPDTVTVTVRVGELRGEGPIICADGRPSGTLDRNGELRVSMGAGACRVVEFSDRPGYYHRLGQKLGWGLRG
jgi:NAD+ kinase